MPLKTMPNTGTYFPPKCSVDGAPHYLVPVSMWRDHEDDAREAHVLQDLASEFRAALHDEYSALTPPDSAPCQASMMRDGRCRCSECRRSRYLTLEAKAEALGISR